MLAEDKMRAIELFAGIGGFRIAMDRLGVETVWVNEINPLSIEVYQKNFPLPEVTRGDIRTIPEGDIPNAEVLTAGFPCQPFSSAGKKLGIGCDTNGTLFNEIIRVLKERKPQYFILENVKRILTMEGGLHFKTILSKLSELDYAIEWRLLDSSNFGVAQTRQRVFIVGTRVDQIKDKSIGSIVKLGSDVDSIISLGSLRADSALQKIDLNRGKPSNWGVCLNNKWYTKNLPLNIRYADPVYIKDILQPADEVDPIFDFTEDTTKRLENSDFVNKFYNGVQLLWNQKGGARFGYTVFGTEGVASTLTASTSRHYERYGIDGKYRRLTNIEYARLMGFPDDWCDVASRYDQYSLFGNAVVPSCVEWVARKLFGTFSYCERDVRMYNNSKQQEMLF